MSTPVQRSALGEVLRIGRGGQGIVYRVPDLRLPGESSDLVYKEYFPGQTPTSALQKVVGVRERLDATMRARLDSLAAWPCALVADGPSVCGLVMPLIPSSYFDERTALGTGRSRSVLREVQNLFIDPRLAQRLGLPMVNLRARLTICRDLAAALALLHDLKLVFGDINAKNAVFRTAGRPTVMLVDCDAVRWVSQGQGVRQLNAPDWEPPEGGRILTQGTDRYKFGLFVLRALTPGRFGSTRRDPEAVSAALDTAGQVLLRAALSPRYKERPALAAWEAYFAERLEGVPSVITAASVLQTPPVERRTAQAMRRDPVTRQWVPVE